jgi:hypothetical protein
MERLCRLLEGMLGRPVVDETGVGEGSFEVTMATQRDVGEFLATLRDRFGFVVTPERREVEWLIVRSHQA